MSLSLWLGLPINFFIHIADINTRFEDNTCCVNTPDPQLLKHHRVSVIYSMSLKPLYMLKQYSTKDLDLLQLIVRQQSLCVQ